MTILIVLPNSYVAGMTFTAMRLTKPYLIYDKTSIALQQDMFFRHGVNIEHLTKKSPGKQSL
jgi:hypothetical protein